MQLREKSGNLAGEQGSLEEVDWPCWESSRRIDVPKCVSYQKHKEEILLGPQIKVGEWGTLQTFEGNQAGLQQVEDVSGAEEKWEVFEHYF